MQLFIVQCLAGSRCLFDTLPWFLPPQNYAAEKYISMHNFTLWTTCVVNCTIKLNNQQTFPSIGE